MADPFNRIPGDQTTYGYRQLPGSGPARGPELKTMVYGTIGVVLGIVAGTILADGSWRSMSPFASHQLVRASSSVPGRPASKPATTPPPSQLAVNQGSPQLPVAQKPAPSSSAPLPQSQVASQLHQQPSAAQKPMAAPPNQAPAHQPVNQGTSQVAALHTPSALNAITSAKPSGAGMTSAALKVSGIHRHRSVRPLIGRARLTGRRKGHFRHRLHPHVKSALIAKLSPTSVSPRLDLAPPRFTFMVEGDVTVANFDALAGTIETYEGETFSLNREPSQDSTISWLDYPPDVHYRCDQSWNCTLIHDGVVLTNARRTR
jgi:hypothetical protein